MQQRAKWGSEARKMEDEKEVERSLFSGRRSNTIDIGSHGILRVAGWHKHMAMAIDLVCCKTC